MSLVELVHLSCCWLLVLPQLPMPWLLEWLVVLLVPTLGLLVSPCYQLVPGAVGAWRHHLDDAVALVVLLLLLPLGLLALLVLALVLPCYQLVLDVVGAGGTTCQLLLCRLPSCWCWLLGCWRRWC